MPTEDSTEYTLSHRGDAVGLLSVSDVDWPWASCDFTPEPGFAAVRDAFVRFLAASEYLGTQEEQRWHQARQDVLSLGIVMEPISVHERIIFPDVLLYVDGDTARFRFSGTPNAQCKPKRLPLFLLPVWRRWALFRWRWRK